MRGYSFSCLNAGWTMSMNDPVLQLGLGGGQTEQGHPGKGGPSML